MKYVIRFVVGVLAVIGVATIAANLVFSSTTGCDRFDLGVAISEDGVYRAGIFSEVCSNTAEGGVFLYVGPPDKSSFSVIRLAEPTSTDFALTWVEADTVEVVYPREVDMNSSSTTVEDVLVTFRSR
ncbi:MAG: hypothetical protein AAF578_04670 [Pseudomonadota bacterium]